jgi:hypothetical protein
VCYHHQRPPLHSRCYPFGGFANTNPDGVSTLLVADGSAAQVGVLTNQIIVSEKSNVIETFDRAVSGNPTLVAGIPSDAGIAVNGNEPFGMVTSGKGAYVTIAHKNHDTLVRQDAIVNSGFTTQASIDRVAQSRDTRLNLFDL